MKLLISSILLAGYASADWQPFFWGTGCPAVTGSSNFDLDSYLGTWYNIANSPFFWMSNKNRCVTAEYEMNEDGSIKVTNGDISRYTDKRVSMEGQAVSTPENGVLSVAFGPIKAKADNGNYFMLDTDNDNYSFVWSCTDYCVGSWCIGHKPVYWILNKKAFYTEEEVNAEIDEAFEVLGGFGYDQKSMEKLRSKMHVAEHEDCDYPEIEE